MTRKVTIIYFKDTSGKAQTLEFSLKGFVFILFCFVMLMFALVVLIVFSAELYVEKTRLTDKISALTLEKETLEARIGKTAPMVNPVESPAAKPQADAPVLPETISSETKEALPHAEGEKGLEPVSLQDLRIANLEENNQIIMSFDLVKESSKGVVIQGYVFLIGNYGETYLTFPEGVEIQEGMPVDFKKGDRFAVKWQKHIERIFPFSTSLDTIKSISVLVFSKDGDLLIKKEVKL